ncbi:hypothetical protein JYU23_01645 [bacterium AH-315-C07]|nr:hypothetical protein [bacterium AH-315-C07]
MKSFAIKTVGLVVILLGFTLASSGQSCPACSNPAIQSNEKLEAGMDTLFIGTFRSTITSTAGFGYKGGHPNSKGLSPEKEIIDVPLHNHKVNLDFYRFQFNFEYSFKNNWTTWLQVPYDLKIQKADIDFVESVTDYTEYEIEAIKSNRDNHHRSETYKGFSDLKLLVAYRKLNIFSKNDRLDVAWGTSLPIGNTEENPLKAGASGEKHLHIQFGTGTFDPIFEFHYAASISRRMTLSFFSVNKYPFYENSQNYIGAFESTSGVSTSYKASNHVVLRANFSDLYMSRARWDGEYDPNSGLFAYNGMIATNIYLKNGLLISPAFRFPIYQKTLTGDGDTFEFGPTVLLNISYAVKTK